MTVEYGRLRTALLEYLRLRNRGQINFMGGAGEIGAFCRERGLSLDLEDQELVCQVFHEFYLERIIVSGDRPNGTGAMAWPFYRVTEFGRKVIEAKEYEPYDPGGYLGRLRLEIPNLDSVIVRYLEEAIGSLRSDHLLAAAVMLGCAAEKAMLLLIDEFGTALSDPAKKGQFQREISSHWMIQRKYVAFWKRLEPMVKSLPSNLGDDLHVMLDRIFDLIRTARNEAGHPTGKVVDRDAVRANLILFPGYCRRAYRLIEHFSANPIP
ncbi:MAG: hypothetical protein KIS92_03260 [Planctomycetota bacterium]|nr:hypothetical protein [Planctomycetota bacterium]